MPTPIFPIRIPKYIIEGIQKVLKKGQSIASWIIEAIEEKLRKEGVKFKK